MSGHLNAYATQVQQNKTQVWFAPKVDPSQMIVMGGHAQISAKKQSKQSPYRLDSTKRLSKNDHNKQSNHDLHMLDPTLTLTSPGIQPPKIDSDTRRSQETLQGTILGKREIEATSETDPQQTDTAINSAARSSHHQEQVQWQVLSQN